VKDGRLVPFTDRQVPLAQPERAHQGGTLVLREHRGHRLGALVKAGVLREPTATLPMVRRISTYNSDSNTPVVAVDEARGFRPVGRCPRGRGDCRPAPEIAPGPLRVREPPVTSRRNHPGTASRLRSAAERRNTCHRAPVRPDMTSRALRALVVPASALLVLAGCGGTEPSEEREVLAAEQVFAEEPVVGGAPRGPPAAPRGTTAPRGGGAAPAPPPPTAVLRVTTELDMACAVVFGQDQNLGDGIATDADMGGGAHTDHQAVMTGLEPGTEYFYRVQGSGSDGNLYRSDLMRFRTPEADAARGPSENVALGATVVDVSSEFSADYRAGAAVDGNLATEWSSAGDGDDASLTLDLGRAVSVRGIAVRSRSMSDGTAVVETFTVTVDGGETYGPFDAGTAGAVAEVEFTGQVLRIDADRTSGGNTGAAEIEVYQAR
jgi:hypothetical protein